MSKIDELLKQQQKIQEEIEAIRNAEKFNIIEELKQKIDAYNIQPNELFALNYLEVREEKSRKRRTKAEKAAEDKEKHEKSIADAKKAFESGLEVRKYLNEKGNKFYWQGKKGLRPMSSEPAKIVKSIEEIE